MTMGNGARLIAARDQRALIPDAWQIEFNGWTNEALLSLADDPAADAKIRAYAGFEVSYRAAAGVYVDESESGAARRTSYSQPADLLDKLGDVEGDAQARKAAMLKNWQGTGTRADDVDARVRQRMAADK
jgi:hypothetical protein